MFAEQTEQNVIMTIRNYILQPRIQMAAGLTGNYFT